MSDPMPRPAPVDNGERVGTTIVTQSGGRVSAARRFRFSRRWVIDETTWPSELRNEAYFFLFTVPCLVLYSMFFITPIILGFYYSLTNWNGIAPTFEFVGLKNFLMQLKDGSFHYSLKFTLTYALLVVPAAVLVSFFSALFLTTVKGRLQTIYKGFLFFPALLAPIVVSLIWKQIYLHALPWIGEALDLEFLKLSLMTNMKTLKGTIQFVHIWQAVALQTVLFVAGLQNIPEEIYDAARIDGTVSSSASGTSCSRTSSPS